MGHATYKTMPRSNRQQPRYMYRRTHGKHLQITRTAAIQVYTLRSADALRAEVA